MNAQEQTSIKLVSKHKKILPKISSFANPIEWDMDSTLI